MNKQDLAWIILQGNSSKWKLATVVEGDLKAPFSIATTPRCRGGRFSIPWIAPLYTWSIPYNAKQGTIEYHFLSLWYDSTWDGTQVSRAISEHSNHYHIGLVGRVFGNGPDELGSIPGQVIPKTLKMVLDTALLSTQQYFYIIAEGFSLYYHFSLVISYHSVWLGLE